MPTRILPNLFLPDSPEAIDYTTTRNSGPKKNFLKLNRIEHGDYLKTAWNSVVCSETSDISWVYVQFEGAPNCYLALKSLDTETCGMQLCNVSYTETGAVRATVKIDCTKRDKFLKKIDEYLTRETEKGNPLHGELMQGIVKLSEAVFESFWRDDPNLCPTADKALWCEIWLSRPEAPEEVFGESFDGSVYSVMEALHIPYKKAIEHFPGRSILLCKANKTQLESFVRACSCVAEFRHADALADVFLELPNVEQVEWAEEFAERIAPADSRAPVVTVLDTGVNQNHSLMRKVMDGGDCMTIEPLWGVGDHAGHGTNMCSTVVYGDLRPLLLGRENFQADHGVESVKILPPVGSNDPELYGDITSRAISEAEIRHSKRVRISCMAVSSEDTYDKGRPSAWSSMIDQLAYGRGGNKRLFILSAGNTPVERHTTYPYCNKESFVQDPAQSWNALTVGAFTQLDRIISSSLRDYTPIARRGELSPYSSTSMMWNDDCPIKPEIVLEGGNTAVDSHQFVTEADELSILAASKNLTREQFSPFRMTSAATALAAKMAASIQAAYPNAWPETVRALLVHSAEWTPELIEQFMRMEHVGKFNKTLYGRMLRFCGYGVPDLDRAIACLKSELTLIAQEEIQPFCKDGNEYKTKDMHLYELPWPKEILQGQLFSEKVRMKVTLSYFIDPGPGSLDGDRYRYESFGLRFAINRPEESIDQFTERVNKAARGETEEKVKYKSESGRWMLGPNNRSVGSIHSDCIILKGADMAACGHIAIYPVIGWWRERHGQCRYNDIARYSLVISLETKKADVDIYTPVATAIMPATPIPT